MPRDEFLPFSPPCLGDEEIAEVADCLRSGWITTGPRTARFESEFARYLGAPAALGLNSCTAGLHTALVALGIGPGDEVIAPTLTFASTVNVIEHAGARPVLVDVEPDTMNLDPERVAAAVTDQTRAVMVVHLGGHPADMDPLREIAAAEDLVLIQDAAHALPAAYKGERIGSGPGPASFSFYATKNLTTAEGGMLTGDPEFLDRARIISRHGMSGDAWRRDRQERSWSYAVVQPGFKYNMTDVQAAMGLKQLEKLDRMQRRRREIVALYDAAFAGCDALETPARRPEVEHAWHLYAVRLNPDALRIDRDRFIAELEDRRIGTSVHFIPVHIQPYYRDRYGFAPQDMPVAMEQWPRLISLPLHPGLSDADAADVIEAVTEVAASHRR